MIFLQLWHTDIISFYRFSQFSRVFSVAVLASAAVAAPQYYYPGGLSRTIYTGAIAQPAAYAVICVNWTTILLRGNELRE